MQWDLHGQAVIEPIEESCIKEPFADINDSKQDYISCMQFCEKLGSQAPSVVDLEDWTELHSQFERPAYKRGLKSMGYWGLWVAISDTDKEGDWRDYYTKEVLKHTDVWGPGMPNSGMN